MPLPDSFLRPFHSFLRPLLHPPTQWSLSLRLFLPLPLSIPSGTPLGRLWYPNPVGNHPGHSACTEAASHEQPQSPDSLHPRCVLLLEEEVSCVQAPRILQPPRTAQLPWPSQGEPKLASRKGTPLEMAKHIALETSAGSASTWNYVILLNVPARPSLSLLTLRFPEHKRTLFSTWFAHCFSFSCIKWA